MLIIGKTGYVCGGTRKLSVPSAHFFCKSTTVLKNEVLFKKYLLRQLSLSNKNLF